MQKELYDLRTVYFDHEARELIILDQTLLPGETKYLRLKTKEEIHNAIYRLCVRGAPAIGVTAAYGIYLAAENAIQATDTQEFILEFEKAKKYLASARPTAVNLFWALERMEICLHKNKNLPIREILSLLLKEADEIFNEDARVCRAIGEHGLSLLKPGMGLLTHCNAGALAASRYGTALAPIYLGQEQGYGFKVYADETRPLLQGARLTTYELHCAGVDVTLICDNMASTVMKNGWVQAVLVGCDRLAANGDAANKVGTSGLAILAKHYNIPFYVCLPTSTIDLNCPTGADIHIEQRSPLEVTHQWYKKPMSPEGVKVYNPAFDVTDASLITAIVTERGIIRPPFDLLP